MKRIVWISGIMSACLLTLLLTGWADADDLVKKALRQGNEQYRTANIEKALQSYESGLEKMPGHKALHFNAAQAAYQLGEYEKAAQYYEGAEDRIDKYLNGGNSFFRMGEATEDVNEKAQRYAQALQIYKEGIIRYPQDVQLKFNYEFVKTKADELSEEMEQESEGENGDQGEQGDQRDQSEDGSNDQNEDENGGANESENEGEENEESQGQESESEEDSQGEQDQDLDSSNQDEASGENQSEMEQDQEAIERILEMLESQEEESLKNNQGVVGGKDEAYGW